MLTDSDERLKIKVIESVVLLRRQYSLTCHLIKNSGKAITEFEDAMMTGTQELVHGLNVFNYVFSLIDHLVRYQKIASSLPVISQRAAQARSFSSAMGKLKDARNQLQHINNHIEYSDTGPLLGTVSWALSDQLDGIERR